MCPWVVQRTLFDRHVVFLPRVLSDLPAEATVDRTTFEAMGTKTLLVMPIEMAGNCLHLVLISTLREARDWPQNTSRGYAFWVRCWSTRWSARAPWRRCGA